LDRLYQHDNLRIPENFDFRKISGLSNEMIDRLERAHPKTFGQIRRIPGLTPAALTTLLIQLTIKRAA
jgi:tRNA uridine 5-carboxymethylaminomethyl modification enzyme